MFPLVTVDSLRWEVLPCEVAGAGGGRGSDDTYDISRYGHTACLIEGCSQIVVFGGMRCGSLSSEGGGSAASDDTPHELNDLLLFDPDMLKWCVRISVITESAVLPLSIVTIDIYINQSQSHFITTFP